MADPQARWVYAVDIALAGPLIENLGEARQITDAILADPWFKRQWPGLKAIRIFDGRGTGTSGCYWYGGATGVSDIRLQKRHMNKRDLLHEIAHACNSAAEMAQFPERRFPEREDHGPEFLAAYLRLVDRYLGWRMATKMRELLRDYPVHWKGKRREP